MLASLRNLFTPQAIAASMKTMRPLETTVMDTLFKDRPTHPLPLIGKSDLVTVTRTVPMVRRDGTPLSLSGDSMSMEFIAPLPIKTKVNVSASELNDLRLMLPNAAALEAWRQSKIETIRQTIRNTCEALCSVVMTTGKVTWPVQLEGGGQELYEIDYGQLPTCTPSQKITADSKMSEVYNLLRSMERQIREAGIGGKVEFMAGTDVTSVLIDLADASRTTAQTNPIRIELGQGLVTVGKYVIRFMDEKYPDPVTGLWVDKLNPKQLLAVATDVAGKIWYCAIDSVTAKNAAVPLHIVPISRDDDTGIALLAQTKPLPARPSRASCIAAVVD